MLRCTVATSVIVSQRTTAVELETLYSRQWNGPYHGDACFHHTNIIINKHQPHRTLSQKFSSKASYIWMPTNTSTTIESFFLQLIQSGNVVMTTNFHSLFSQITRHVVWAWTGYDHNYHQFDMLHHHRRPQDSLDKNRGVVELVVGLHL
jgi:hypothetical protein